MSIDYFNDVDEKDNFEDTYGDEETEPVEIPKEVRHLRTQSYDKSVRDLIAMIDDQDIDLDPDYQRNYLWDNKKASLLIESILLNIPIPVIYVAENDESQWNVIDGLQRLTSLERYFKNEFKLTKLDVLNELNGLTYHNLPPKPKRILNNGMLRVVVLLAETHPEIKYDVFMRLNTGSVKLNEQELRNCLYRGSFNSFIKECRNNKVFQSCLKITEPHKRFADAELILRFFAIRENINLNTGELNYPGRMKTFLNNYMVKNQTMTESRICELRDLFLHTMDNINSVLGATAFRRVLPDGAKEVRVNRSLSDIVMLCFSVLDKKICVENKEELENIISELCKNPTFVDSITLGTSDSRKIETRLTLALQAFGIIKS
jgi:hypothetical protein